MSAPRHSSNVLRFRSTPAKRSQHDGPAANHECSNCGTRIQGNFCHACGQAAHVHHSLLHLVEEMVHGLWHFDAKGWRTLPLLVANPGELTRRYIDGQRVRFIAPLGLYLFMVFFMFFSLSMLGAHDDSGDLLSKGGLNKLGAVAEMNTKIANAGVAVDKAQAELDQAKKSGQDVTASQKKLSSAQEEKKSLETALAALEALPTAKVTDNDAIDKAFDVIDDDPDVPPAAAPRAQKASKNETVQKIKKAVKSAKDNPELALYKVKNNAYKFALILVPLSMPFLWLMFFWRKQVTMFDHAVFCLYSLSFMAFLVSVVDLTRVLGFGQIAVWLALLVPPVHMYRHLKGTYQLTNGETWWRAMLLAFIALVMVLLYMVFVFTVSVV